MNTIKLRAPPRILSSRWLSPEEVPEEKIPSREEAYQEGSKTGYKDGWEKAQLDCKKELEQHIQEFHTQWDVLFLSLNSFPRDLAQQLREQLVTLAFVAIKKLLAATPITREEVEAQINQMLNHVEAGTDIQIEINPDDLTLLKAEANQAFLKEEFTHLKWTPNPSLPRGSCFLRGDFGWMDGRRETRLHKLEQVALDSIRDPSS